MTTMLDLVKSFPDQVAEALKLEAAAGQGNLAGVKNCVIQGMGGSGIGGAIARKMSADDVEIPIITNNSYNLPGFVNNQTLLIACSYSGNTEETLKALETGLKKGAVITAITSGGKLAELSEKNQFGITKLPGGMPPRAAFGYSFVGLLKVLVQLPGMSKQGLNGLKAAPGFLAAQQPAIIDRAQQLASEIHETIPVIYSDNRLEGVAVRMRQQLNENAKMLAWHHTIPEMNHNEIVGWRKVGAPLSVLFMEDGAESGKNAKRKAYVEDLVKKYTAKVFTITATGDGQILKWLYLIHLADWLSVKLAEVRHVDPVEIEVIQKLKASLQN